MVARKKVFKYQLAVFLVFILGSLAYNYLVKDRKPWSYEAEVRKHRQLGSSCTDYCDPSGGPISITGAMVGQVSA